MRLNRISKLVAALLLAATTVSAQVGVPNTFSPNTVAQSALVNANFAQLGSLSLNRAGGIVTGNISVDPGVTIDGVDIGAVLGGSGSPTFANVTITGTLGVTGNATFTTLSTSGVLSPTSVAVTSGVTIGGTLAVNNAGASALDVAGGIQAGSGNVSIVGTDGRIPALTTVYFASMDGSTITGIAEANITDGTLLARVAANETITGVWSFTHAAPEITLDNATSNWIQWSGNGAAPPSTVARSAGMKLLLFPNFSAGVSTDFAIGIDASVLWFGTPATTNNFVWYGGTTVAASLSGTGNLSIVGGLTTAGIISPAALGVGNNNDYTPAGLAAASMIFVAANAGGSTITGITGGANGRLLTVCNSTGAAGITLTDEDTNSAAGNRIRTIATVLGPGGGATARCADLIYVAGATNRWFVKSRT